MWKMLTSAHDEIADSFVVAYTMAVDALKAQTDGDTISRQVAIDAVQGIGRLATLPDNDAAVRMSAVEYVLFNLPSAQPEPNYDEWCTDCKEYDKERHCCPRWNRVIRETLKDAQPEIIRCKDCKHYDPNDHCYLQGAEADDFCSYAERRTDE